MRTGKEENESTEMRACTFRVSTRACLCTEAFDVNSRVVYAPNCCHIALIVPWGGRRGARLIPMHKNLHEKGSLRRRHRSPPAEPCNQSPSCAQLTLPSLSSAEEERNKMLRGRVDIQLTQTTRLQWLARRTTSSSPLLDM